MLFVRTRCKLTVIRIQVADLKEAIREFFNGGLYRIHYYLFLRVAVIAGYDSSPQLFCDFDTLEDVWSNQNNGRDCDFALRIRTTALCALRWKQEQQAGTNLPMSAALVALLDESDAGRGCMCQVGGHEAEHQDVFTDSPEHEGTLDSFRESASRHGN